MHNEINDATFYKYNAKFDGMNLSDAAIRRALEGKANCLKWMLADANLHIVHLTERGQQVQVVRQIRALLNRFSAMRGALGDRVQQAKNALN